MGKLKRCGECGKAITSKRNRFYCSNACYQLNKVGANNPKWRGGSYLVDGYRYVYRPEHPNRTQVGYVAEHRLVMEQSLGRLLEKREVVHHRDHDRLNNSIENLELCSSTGKHFVQHHLAKRDALGRFHATV